MERLQSARALHARNASMHVIWAINSTQDFQSRRGNEANGDFGTNKNGVPQNILAVKYILHAYDITYTTFKRMKKADKELPQEKAPHPTKGKSIFENKDFAAAWYSPYRMYVRLKFSEWLQTEVGRNADKNRKPVVRTNHGPNHIHNGYPDHHPNPIAVSFAIGPR
jgi:hypothetical protein